MTGSRGYAATSRAGLALASRAGSEGPISMSDFEAHRHRYRSPLAAIIGLSEAALLREDLDADLVKLLRAIRALAQDAVEADEENVARRAAKNQQGG
jgi:signal transduction histidine kinase